MITYPTSRLDQGTLCGPTLRSHALKFCAHSSGMSALGQKQTLSPQKAMSALPSNADIAPRVTEECSGDHRTGHQLRYKRHHLHPAFFLRVRKLQETILKGGGRVTAFLTNRPKQHSRRFLAKAVKKGSFLHGSRVLSTGAPEEIRTPDPQIRSQLLRPLSAKFLAAHLTAVARGRPARHDADATCFVDTVLTQQNSWYPAQIVMPPSL